MITKIGVVGAGQMGAGIAQVAAMNGFSVILNDIEDIFLQRAIGYIEKGLSILLKKERISEAEREAALGEFKQHLKSRISTLQTLWWKLSLKTRH